MSWCPSRKGPSWDEAKGFARTFSEAMAKAAPDRFTTNIRKAARTGKIFIDYLRNGEGASAVAAYSTRARKGAPIALPIDWNELKALKGGDAFHMKDAVKRAEERPVARHDHRRDRRPEAAKTVDRATTRASLLIKSFRRGVNPESRL